MALPLIATVAAKLGIEVGKYIIKKAGQRVLKKGAADKLRKQVAAKEAKQANLRTSKAPTKKQIEATKKRNRELEEKRREKSSVEMRTKVMKSRHKKEKARGEKPYDQYHERVKEAAQRHSGRVKTTNSKKTTRTQIK